MVLQKKSAPTASVSTNPVSYSAFFKYRSTCWKLDLLLLSHSRMRFHAIFISLNDILQAIWSPTISYCTFLHRIVGRCTARKLHIAYSVSLSGVVQQVGTSTSTNLQSNRVFLFTELSFCSCTFRKTRSSFSDLISMLIIRSHLAKSIKPRSTISESHIMWDVSLHT